MGLGLGSGLGLGLGLGSSPPLLAPVAHILSEGVAPPERPAALRHVQAVTHVSALLAWLGVGLVLGLTVRV